MYERETGLVLRRVPHLREDFLNNLGQTVEIVGGDRGLRLASLGAARALMDSLRDVKLPGVAVGRVEHLVVSVRWLGRRDVLAVKAFLRSLDPALGERVFLVGARW